MTPALLNLTENVAPFPSATVTVGVEVYPDPGLKTSTVRIPPLVSTVLTTAVACTPPAGGADMVTTEDIVYPVPGVITSIPLLDLPP